MTEVIKYTKGTDSVSLIVWDFLSVDFGLRAFFLTSVALNKDTVNV